MKKSFFLYSSWCTNEPNNYKAPRNTFGEACAIIVGDCLWDFDCATNSNGYVCEKGCFFYLIIIFFK